MTFLHEDPDFGALLDIVAKQGPITSAAMVEKDYWITHVLWAVERCGLALWFKGGTSLAKGFGIVPRFSEDIDLVILPGKLSLPTASSWKTETEGAAASRTQFWEALRSHLNVPGADVIYDRAHDPTQRNVGFRVTYPGRHLGELQRIGAAIRPYILLEMSHGSVPRSARAPAVARGISSAVHDYVEAQRESTTFAPNRPATVRCVHPHVTLLEKIDAITRRYARGDADWAPESFVRHYEDAARIIRSEERLEPLEGSIGELASEMLAKRQIRQMVTADHPALTLKRWASSRHGLAGRDSQDSLSPFGPSIKDRAVFVHRPRAGRRRWASDAARLCGGGGKGEHGRGRGSRANYPALLGQARQQGAELRGPPFRLGHTNRSPRSRTSAASQGGAVSSRTRSSRAPAASSATAHAS